MNRSTASMQRTTHAPYARPKKNTALLTLLRAGIVFFGGLITVLGLLLLILPAFRVKEIVVEGNSFYSDEQIIAYAGISIGEEVLAVDVNAAIDRILEACPYVNGVSVRSKSPTTICIEVKEKSNLMYTAFNGKYVAFDDVFTVVSESGDAAAYKDLLFVELPPIAALSVGGQIHFANEKTDMSYVCELIEALRQKGDLDLVSAIDFSQKYTVSYVLQEKYRVVLGKVGELDTKFLLVDHILLEKEDRDAYAVVDVSSIEKPTYRVVSASDFLMN